MYVITYIDKTLPNLIKEQILIQEGKGRERETGGPTSYQYINTQKHKCINRS